MKIAITAWGNRISPVFDAAGTLLVADIQNHTVTQKTYHPFEPSDIGNLAELMHREQVNTLICGAISTQPATRLVEHHIHLISFVSGNAMEVLDSFAARHTIDQTFIMPGCRRNHTRQPSF